MQFSATPWIIAASLGEKSPVNCQIPGGRSSVPRGGTWQGQACFLAAGQIPGDVPPALLYVTILVTPWWNFCDCSSLQGKRLTDIIRFAIWQSALSCLRCQDAQVAKCWTHLEQAGCQNQASISPLSPAPSLWVGHEIMTRKHFHRQPLSQRVAQGLCCTGRWAVSLARGGQSEASWHP